MNSEKFNTKQSIADYYKKHDMCGIEKLYKQIIESKELKHYELSISASSHEFTYTCSTIYEVLDALADASATFRFEVNLDDVMCILVKMKNGDLLSTESYKYRITVRKGEV